ncbi:MAG: radical SAM protein [Desulfitobacteriaceae bacterium]|nr:radical SAM protein [Desulfitobacteriaceae bacterium]MDD4752797.1 radical SAM protein [Desulfitobacteriaceae bacterium]
MLFARPNGELLDIPDIKMAGRSGDSFLEPLEEELIPLPEGASLTAVPYRYPVGIGRKNGEFLRITTNPYRRNKEEVWAVGALLPQGFTRTLLPAFSGDREKPIPLFGYTAVGVRNGRFIVGACQTDQHRLWNPVNYNTKELALLVEEKTKAFPQNRLLRQLGKCALEYGCFTAQNIFYKRWEGGIPVSPSCNARCIGCISSQPAECCPSPQGRLEFVPTLQEVTEIAIPHLAGGEDAIISFGQGCEGEPSLQGELIAASIQKIRQTVDRGTININTNGGDTEKLKIIVDAGIDAIRLSMISADPEIYRAYHRPQGYTLDNVRDSLKYAVAAGVYVSLNLLHFPGVTDDASQIEALIGIIKETGVQKIQLRNLNIDPDVFLKIIPEHFDSPLGVPQMISLFKEEIPWLEIGNYSRPVV